MRPVDAADSPHRDAADFPHRFAHTRRFSLGVPGAFTISPRGDRVVFLRSGDGRDPVQRMWTLDLAPDRGTATERLVADPDVLLDGGADELSPQEQVRRERARERAGGIVAYATDGAVRRAAFTLSGRLWWADLDTGETREVAVAGPVVDPRFDPAGERIAFVRDGALHLVDLADTAGSAERVLAERVLAAPENGEITYGSAEHAAAEGMGRTRGFWWAPDGSRLLVARVDTTSVQRWYLADPANPQDPPREIAYPAAGTANADVSLWLVDLDGARTAVEWDRDAFEYLVAVGWSRDPLLAVQSRDQRAVRVLRVDPASGATETVRAERDGAWVAVAPGTPAQTASGELVWVAGVDDTYRLLRDGHPVTPPGLQVREVLDVDGDTVLLTASYEPTEIHLWRHAPETGLVRLTERPGVYGGRRGGGVTIVTARSLDHDGTQVSVQRDGAPPIPIAGYGEPLGIALNISLLSAGAAEIRTAVLLPSWHRPGSGPLPVLLDPYGGPALQLVVRARTWSFGISQWFAEQGFAVVVADGRGTPGRGLAWERTIRGDTAGPALEDQITALRVAAERHPDLDLSRVGIRGWSYGGFLAALAVLRRPDVFHAAVAGAPVTDQRLYDTYWKERFLGHPDQEPENYDRCSLLSDAGRLRRPLLLIHGLADDNVVVAHTLRLSAALLAAGRPHTVLPLPGVTHMSAQAHATEHMLRQQLDFLRRSLDVPAASAASADRVSRPGA